MDEHHIRTTTTSQNGNDEPQERVSRRTLIGRAAAFVVGALAAAVAPNVAEATDGDTVRVGQQAYGSSANPAVWGVNNSSGEGVLGYSKNLYGVSGYSEGTEGVRGRSKTGIGVYGQGDGAAPGVKAYSVTGDGIEAVSKVDPKSAVYAHNDGGGYGVYAVTKSTLRPAVAAINSSTGPAVTANATVGCALEGQSTSGDAVSALATTGRAVSANSNTGVGTYSRSVESVGVYGQSTNDAGVYGYSTSSTGVMARSPDGTALSVDGRAKFSTAGKSTLYKGWYYRKVTGVKVGTNSGILVTLNGNAGVYVKYAYRNDAASFTVLFSGPATKTATFAYFIIN